MSSVSRDTLVFHADSIPDTLKVQASFRSFYSPAKIISKTAQKVLPDSVTSDSLSLGGSVKAASQPDTFSVEPTILQVVPESSTNTTPLVLPDSTK